MPDILLAITLFGEGGQPQLCGPAMVKTAPTHTVSRILGAFCSWAGVSAESVAFHNVNGRVLSGDVTVADCALASGHAITAILASSSASQPSAAACAATFAMLDVEDSELANLSGSLNM